MKHFDTASWTDFVRGIASEDLENRLEQHLATGCTRCNRQVKMLRSVAEDAAAEQAPPSWAVRSVTAFFRMQQPRLQRQLPRIPVASIFDSLLVPLPAGTRSLQATSRHVVYNARQFTLDVRMDYSRSDREMLIVGQIVERRGLPVVNAPAFLVANAQLLSRALTGDLGEFQMSCKPKGKLTLCLSMDSNELIEVELDRRPEEDTDSSFMKELFPWSLDDRE